MEGILSSFRKKKKVLRVDPGPHDFTLEKRKKYMDRIRIGDTVDFYSIGECYTLAELDRHNTKIPATGVVVAIPGHRRFVTVELRRGVRESVGFFDIRRLNGVDNPHFRKGGDCTDATRASGKIIWQ